MESAASIEKTAIPHRHSILGILNVEFLTSNFESAIQKIKSAYNRSRASLRNIYHFCLPFCVSHFEFLKSDMNLAAPYFHILSSKHLLSKFGQFWALFSPVWYVSNQTIAVIADKHRNCNTQHSYQLITTSRKKTKKITTRQFKWVKFMDGTNLE